MSISSFKHWGEPLPPIVGPGDPRYLEKYPHVIVAKQLLPDFQIKYHVFDYLEEMKQYGDLVY